MSFGVRRTAAGGETRVEVAGEVDIETAPRMRAALAAAQAGGGPVVADLGAVTFMDSGGLAVLVAAHRAAEAQGQDFRLADVPAGIRRLFRITGLDALFALEPVEGDRSA